MAFLKKWMFCGLAVGSIMLAGMLEISQSAGMGVSPAGLLIQGIRPGEVYDIYEVSKTGLTIYNKDNRPMIYLLSAHRPSTVGSRRWEKGYLEIPDPAWCWFENREVTVEANGRGLAKIYLSVPDEEKYYNQHWIVTLRIRGKPGAGLGIGVRINVRLQIETQSTTDIEGKPDGIIAFKPSTLRFDNLPLRRDQKGIVLICNNDNETRSYRVASLLHEDEARGKRYLTRPYQMIPDPSWIAVNTNEMHIPPGRAYPLSVTVTVPKEPKHYGKKWEEILLVEPDKGPSGFVRIQIETRKAGVD